MAMPISEQQCSVQTNAGSFEVQMTVHFDIFIYLSGVFFSLTAVAVFRKPNATPLCFSVDLVLNFLLSWLLVLLPSTFFLDILFFLLSHGNQSIINFGILSSDVATPM